MLWLVFVELFVILLVMLATGSVFIVGRSRLRQARLEYRDRLSSVAPYAGLFAVVLVANKIARDVGPAISWLVGVRITHYLRQVDGHLLWPLYPEQTPQVVVWLQSMSTPALTAYFSFAYIYLYAFLLVFPFVAYFALRDPRPLRRTIVAYGVNYVVGVGFYILFIAYGPRNFIVESAEGLLYTQYSQYQFVTTAVNDQTNVFPSLHASMAVTAALLAWTTRDEYPLWVPLSWTLAVSVVVSTMYLGIHWAADVIAGFALAWVSVRIGHRLEDTPPAFDRFGRHVRRVVAAIRAPSR